MRAIVGSAIVLLLLGCVFANDRRAYRSALRLKLLSDFVIATSTTQERLPLIRATRGLRAGIRTFIAVDSYKLAKELNARPDSSNHNETYAFYPDRLHSNRPWEARWMAAPFLAHQHYGSTYKWMLLGDDDTLWFVVGLRRLLQRFNHSLPYFISDNIVDYVFEPKTFYNRSQNLFMTTVLPEGPGEENFLRPSWLADMCLPCHAEQAAKRLQEGFKGTPLDGHQWLGCPCTNYQGCRYRSAMCNHQNRPDEELCFLHSSGHCYHSWPWGGTGMVTSLGLMEQLTWQGSVRKYVEEFLSGPDFYNHAGDWMLALMVYEAASPKSQQGYSITVPPYSAIMKGKVLSDKHVVFGPADLEARGITMDPAGALLNGTCGAYCTWLIRHVVSHHASVNGDYGHSINATVDGINAIVASHKLAHRQLAGRAHLQEQQQVGDQQQQQVGGQQQQQQQGDQQQQQQVGGQQQQQQQQVSDQQQQQKAGDQQQQVMGDV